MSTITDVAKAAGVSVATVSRALRGLDRVSPETRERVIAVAAQLNYVASPTATSLASGKTRVIGLVTPFIDRWYFATLLSAVERQLHLNGFRVLLFTLQDDAADQREPLTRDMLWRRVDGLVTLNLPLTEAELNLLSDLGMPAVSVGVPLEDLPCIYIDEYQVTRALTEHLISLGHRRIGFVGGIPDSSSLILTPQQRFDAFVATLADHDLEFQPQWQLKVAWNAYPAYDMTPEYLAQPDPPTAIVAASDELAIGVWSAANRAGITVPDELSIGGIDDFYLSELLGLTTVRQDVDAQGTLAADVLVSALVEGEREAPRHVAPTELLVRRSTGPAPTA